MTSCPAFPIEVFEAKLSNQKGHRPNGFMSLLHWFLILFFRLLGNGGEFRSCCFRGSCRRCGGLLAGCSHIPSDHAGNVPALGDPLGNLGGAVDNVLQQLGAVAVAIQGDLIHIGKGFGHILGNGGQGIHDHLNNSRLAVFLHGLSFLINALYPCQRLGLDGRGLTYSGDTGYFLLLGKLVCCQLEIAVYMMYNYYVNLLERIW